MGHLGTIVSFQISWKLVRKIFMMISRSALNMGRLGSKTRSHSPNIKDFVSVQISWKLVRKVVLLNSLSNLNMCHLGSKIRSHRLNVENPR
jgi:hypothetical protein